MFNLQINEISKQKKKKNALIKYHRVFFHVQLNIALISALSITISLSVFLKDFFEKSVAIVNSRFLRAKIKYP